MPPANRIGLTVIALMLSLHAGVAAAQMVAVVSTKNPVTTMSKNQVLDIFLGKTSRFPDGSLAVPIDQVEGSAERDEFYAKVADKSPAQIKAHWSKIIFTGRGRPPEEVANSIEVKKWLIKDPRAIGYIDKAMVDASVRVLLAE
jgi:ABC-type phosphate transport system substrate-binding protein